MLQRIKPGLCNRNRKLACIIALWTFTKNYQLTFGLTSNYLQTSTVQA